MQRVPFLTLIVLPASLSLVACGADSNQAVRSAAGTSSLPEGGSRSEGGTTATSSGVVGGTSQTSQASVGGRANPGVGGAVTSGGSATNGGAATSGGTTAVVTVPRTNSPWPATEFGRAEADVATLSTAPGPSFYIGGWTHTVEPLGTATTGNDYPFVVPCSNSVGSTTQLLLMISGNIGYDSGYGAWAYNQNITTNSGDYATIYAHTGQFGYPSGTPDEAAIRGWVYVAWHYRPTSTGTAVSQYLKFGTGGLVVLTEDVIDGTGGWSGNPTARNELVTPKSISIGGGPRGWAKIYLQFVKIYEMATAPSLEQVTTIALRTEPDATAWADWPLIGGDLADVSGHGRNLTAVDSNGKKGTLYTAIPGPKF